MRRTFCIYAVKKFWVALGSQHPTDRTVLSEVKEPQDREKSGGRQLCPPAAVGNCPHPIRYLFRTGF